MEALKAKIKNIKSNVTKVSNWLEKNQDLNNVYQFEIKEQDLINSHNKYKNLIDEIEELGDDTFKVDCETIDEKCCITIAALREIIDQLKTKPITTHVQVAPSTKLPEISITPFSGNFSEWNAFIDLFNNLIANNPGLTNIQKFIYLKSYLKGEPLELIDSLQLTNENFSIALNTLKERYENEFRIVNSYVKKLFDPNILTKCTASEIRNFLTQSKQALQSLENLNISKEEWADLFLIHVFTQKLDFNTNKAFEAERDPKKLPTLNEFFNFLDKRCSVMETVALNFPKSTTHSTANKRVPKASFYTNTQNDNSKMFNKIKCLYCNLDTHRISQCIKFKNLTVQQRFNIVKEKKLCRNCLSPQHTYEQCTSQGTCLICNKKHHSLIHLQNFQSQSQPNKDNSNNNTRNTANSNQNGNKNTNQQTKGSSKPNQKEESNSTECHSVQTVSNPTQRSDSTLSCSALSSSENDVLLATALVTLYSNEGEKIVARALLDNGSQTSFITKGLVNKLKCKAHKINMQITSISQQVTRSQDMVNLTMYSNLQNNKQFSVRFVILDKITSNLPRVKLDTNFLNLPENYLLADPNFCESKPIDILLGMDVYGDLLCSGIYKLGKGLPILINTYLGWTISGNIPIQARSTHLATNLECKGLQNDANQVSLFLQTMDSDQRADQLIQQFWKVEEITSKLPKSCEDDLAEKIFNKTTTRREDGRFQVNLPLKQADQHLKLGESYSRALKRFYSLENKLQKNETLFKEYKSFIDEYISLGHAKEVPLRMKNERSELKYFLPHHCVIREESVTTKLRVVFDASMKTDSDYSLNDIMLKGFQVQPELFDILCSFRLFEFVFIADIEKMFRQIKINPDQTFLQNILWRDSPAEKIKCLELQTVTYGTNSAPYLSTRCLLELANTNEEKYPLAADALKNQCYVDDILYGCNTKEQLLEAHNQLTELLSSAGMNLHKWCSNSKEFLRKISNNCCQEKYIIKSESNTSKVLGMSWDPNDDHFTITLPEEPGNKAVTKRQVLSVIAQIFDPIGLINPYVVLAKIFMQKIWLEKIDWDSTLGPNLLKEWEDFLKGLPVLKKSKIPRNLFEQPRNKIKQITIHGFSDASLKCYGACVYIRVMYIDNTVSCRLITSKSRVAPLKQLTLPRLELSGAVLLAKLVNKIISIFENKLSIESVYLWTDSQIVLSWIKSHPSKWSIFVGNRVSEIQELTSAYQWNYIKSSENPADILSRGCMPKDFLDSKLWWHGPQFLHDLDFKPTGHQFKEIKNLPEERKASLFNQSKCKNDFYETVLTKYSSFRKLQRVLAYCLRACHNLKNMTRPSKRLTGSLSSDELSNAEMIIIKIVQNTFFANEIQEVNTLGQVKNKSLKTLHLILDKFSMLRVGGRLLNADIAYEHKHPLLLPSKNAVVRLLIKREHLRLLHAGPQNVLANLRLKYWPVDGLREVKGVIRQCLTCFRFRAQPAEQIMADLPKERITVTRPFLNVGIDFGGPFLIKPVKLRSKTFVKCYLAVFVCMATKAVHLELVSSLTTEDFLQALKRFIGRRGLPTVIFSDNGTNFQGANHKLKELFGLSQDNPELIGNYLENNNIKWKFIPARSPHWGGLWEAAIKSAKYHILRVIGDTPLTFEEFSTVLVEIEAVLNSRPLCPLSNDPNDFSCLTPGHFLIGCPLTAIPEKDISNVPENRLNRWQRCVQMRQSFWKRWTVEYLNHLQKRSKWMKPHKNLKIGDMVLLMDESCPPLKWPLARISEVLPGSDKHVRAVKVKTKDGTFTRSITKVCPLPEQDF